MTPTRVKRNSKAPNRFSSDNTKVESANLNGDLANNHNDRNTSTNQSSSPMNRANKLKSGTREPLKVKLPKLKRPHLQAPINDSSIKSNSAEQVRIHKIKLPSLLAKKKKNLGDECKSKKKDLATLPDSKFHETSQPNRSNSHNTTPTHQESPSLTGSKQEAKVDLDASKSSISTNPNISQTSQSSGAYKSADTSTSSDHDGSEMVITVTKVESPNGSGIRCPCGVDDDLGVMVECEKCSLWQHGHCINIGTEDDAYEGYTCAYCVHGKDQARESLQRLYIVDNNQSHFELVESLIQQDPNIASEDIREKVHFSIDDLSQAIRDLKRVLGSLKVKWRLFSSQSYEIELRIWQNPYWSSEKTDDNKEKNFYFLDRCKQNLKLNIRNMLRKMELRCQATNLAISAAKASKKASREFDEMAEIKFNGVSEALDHIEKTVQEIKSTLNRLT